MKVIVQVVKEAKVVINNEIYSEIGPGYLLYVGFKKGDTLKNVDMLANKLAKLRINPDEDGKININGIDANREILSVSQFTLYADSKKGNRPSFTTCLSPQVANELYQQFNEKLANLGFEVKTGVFQADMQISSINDGPLTFILENDVDS